MYSHSRGIEFLKWKSTSQVLNVYLCSHLLEHTSFFIAVHVSSESMYVRNMLAEIFRAAIPETERDVVLLLHEQSSTRIIFYVHAHCTRPNQRVLHIFEKFLHSIALGGQCRRSSPGASVARRSPRATRRRWDPTHGPCRTRGRDSGGVRLGSR